MRLDLSVQSDRSTILPGRPLYIPEIDLGRHRVSQARIWNRPRPHAELPTSSTCPDERGTAGPWVDLR